MEIKPKQPSVRARATGSPATAGSTASRSAMGITLTVSAVHFPPGARTAWHSHSLRQTLYVTEGHGLVQSHSEPIITTHLATSGTGTWPPRTTS